MPNKPALNVHKQLDLLKSRGMIFRNENESLHFLKNISYYRLKGYWWDMQDDLINHHFVENTFFEEVIDRYNFDRHLRIILFDAIERIEISLRTKLIYNLSLSFGGLWYLDDNLFTNDTIRLRDGSIELVHEYTLKELQKEFDRSQEIFIKDHRSRHPNTAPDAWKILEVATIGTLSKLYKCLKHQLPEKSIIAREMGLNSHNELSSWLESITYTRNIIAHHSRLWSRTMVKKPTDNINNPSGNWFLNPLSEVQKKKPFLIISCLIYLCNHITPGHQIKNKILELIDSNPNIKIYKLGFLNNWRNEPIWR